MSDAMTPYHQQSGITIYHGDCREVMSLLQDSSIDAIVTDPPYGLSFMGKNWDHGVPGSPFWIEMLRVAKPGAHLLAFGGSRTYHRLACAIEDAGWEIRDQIQWVYGSGFPKSLDVSKAIDKAAGETRVPNGKPKPGHESFANRGNVSSVQSFSNSTMGQDGGFSRPWMEDSGKIEAYHQDSDPVTDEAKHWDGWGTALKPAHEPIVMARKPLIGTVAQNVLQHGTGAINIDGCRVPHVDVGDGTNLALNPHKRTHINGGNGGHVISTEKDRRVVVPDQKGRFPANFIHDGSEEVVSQFPETTSGKPGVMRCGENTGSANGTESRLPGTLMTGFGDTGSAARFFYCAKADSSERRGSRHPTVKPLDLMRYLVRMVTPTGGTVFDPFAGSGTTLEAAMKEHCKAIGADLDESYCKYQICRLAQPMLNLQD